jgi:hypothetical protein
MIAKAKKRWRRNYSPTPEEIQDACAEIRRDWSEEQHVARATGVLLSEAAERPHWTPPVVSVRELAAARRAGESS